MSKYELYNNLIVEMCERLEETDLNNLKNVDVWDATLMRFQVIGENLKKIPMKFKKKYPLVKWKNFEWFRNQISHEYGGVSSEIIRDLIKNDLNLLKEKIKEMKKNLQKIK
ncbi:DUF86 domain-containing protein [Candidatus Pacearchaeota archaeon]|nr:DUF86 domain-containing protein [Candidatus Pacearchaeota archaeon]